MSFMDDIKKKWASVKEELKENNIDLDNISADLSDKARELTTQLKSQKDELLAQLDTDGDGKISAEERKASMNKLYEDMKGKFQELKNELTKD